MQRTVYESIELVCGNVHAGLGQAEEGNDGLARVTANDGDGGGVWLAVAGDLSNEGLSTNNVEGGDTEELGRVKDTSSLEDLSGDWDGRVDGIGDDEDERLGGILGDALDETLDDASVDVEQVVTGHARLSYWADVSKELHPQ